MFPNFVHLPPPYLPLFPSLGLSCSGTARGADGPSVIQRGMFHVHLAQAQIPPAGKLFSGQPPVIRLLESTAQHNTALSLSVFHPLSVFLSLSFLFITTSDIHICLINLFTLLYLLRCPSALRFFIPHHIGTASPLDQAAVMSLHLLLFLLKLIINPTLRPECGALGQKYTLVISPNSLRSKVLQKREKQSKRRLSSR